MIAGRKNRHFERTCGHTDHAARVFSDFVGHGATALNARWGPGSRAFGPPARFGAALKLESPAGPAPVAGRFVFVPVCCSWNKFPVIRSQNLTCVRYSHGSRAHRVLGSIFCVKPHARVEPELVIGLTCIEGHASGASSEASVHPCSHVRSIDVGRDAL